MLLRVEKKVLLILDCLYWISSRQIAKTLRHLCQIGIYGPLVAVTKKGESEWDRSQISGKEKVFLRIFRTRNKQRQIQYWYFQNNSIPLKTLQPHPQPFLNTWGRNEMFSFVEEKKTFCSIEFSSSARLASSFETCRDFEGWCRLQRREKRDLSRGFIRFWCGKFCDSFKAYPARLFTRWISCSQIPLFTTFYLLYRCLKARCKYFTATSSIIFYSRTVSESFIGAHGIFMALFSDINSLSSKHSEKMMLNKIQIQSVAF